MRSYLPYLMWRAVFVFVFVVLCKFYGRRFIHFGFIVIGCSANLSGRVFLCFCSLLCCFIELGYSLHP